MVRLFSQGLRGRFALCVTAGLLAASTAWGVAPVFTGQTSPATCTPPVGSLTLVILANDADNDNITLTFDPQDPNDFAPSAQGVDPVFTQTVNDPGHAEATLTWNAPAMSDHGLSFSATVHGTDGTTAVTDSFTIFVNQAPTMTAIANKMVDEGATLSFSPIASDPDETEGPSFTLAYSGSNLPSGATVDPATGAFAFDAGCNDAATFSNVTITVDDGMGGTDSQSFDIDVNVANCAPVLTAIANQTVDEGDLLTITPTVTDGDSDPLAFSGVNLPTGAAVDANTGAFTWTPGYTDAGTYTNVEYWVDDLTDTVSDLFDITVNNVNVNTTINAIGNQTVDEGVLLTVTPTYTNPDNDVLTWSGSNLPSGATVDAATGVFEWTPDCAQSGSFSNVTLTADDGTTPVDASFDITVAEACTPVAAVSAHAPASAFNRHRVGEAPFLVSFDVLGELSDVTLRAEDVRLELNGRSLSADATYGVRIEGSTVTVGFASAGVASLVSSVTAGSTVDMVLRVITPSGEFANIVPLVVTGLSADAAVRSWPVPARTSSTIEYVVPEDGVVTLSLYGADGRQVRELVNGSVVTGVYTLRWDGRTDAGTLAPRGLYYVRGAVSGTPVTAPIVVLR